MVWLWVYLYKRVNHSDVFFSIVVDQDSSHYIARVNVIKISVKFSSTLESPSYCSLISLKSFSTMVLDFSKPIFSGGTRCVIESSFTLALEIPFHILESTVMRYSSILEPLLKIGLPVSVMPMSSTYRWLLSSPLGSLESSVHLYLN